MRNMGTVGWLCVLCGILAVFPHTATACNEAVCASLVSKCMLLQSCECNLMNTHNCTCCKACHLCLAKLYTECCSCVGMCPEQNEHDHSYRSSTVEELSEPFPELFNVLTEEADPYLRWTTHTYPAHLDLLYFKPHGVDLNLNPPGASNNIGTTSDSMNCTVAYMSECVPLRRCRVSCQSMGARRYRWFHEYGCCECIGSSCLDYGKGEPLCRLCSAETQVAYGDVIHDHGGSKWDRDGGSHSVEDIL